MYIRTYLPVLVDVSYYLETRRQWFEEYLSFTTSWFEFYQVKLRWLHRQ